MKYASPSLIARLLTGAALIVLPTSALAANAPPTPADQANSSETATLGEVVVTAQKRSENLQDVPLAVNVVTSQQLQANSVRSFTDLNRVAPSLVVKPAENPVNASVSIRGVGTYAFSPGVEPSVAVVVDDVPIAFQARAFADLSDIERIEVLRGPQSTLYGKSASAGLINIVTPAPTRAFTGKVGLLATTDEEYQAQLMISGPLADTLGVRLTANYDDFQGNIRNLYNGEEVNGRRVFSTRNKVQWEPSSSVTVTAGIDYIDGETTTGRPLIRVGPNTFLRGNTALPVSVFAPGVTVGPNNRDVVNNVTTGTQYHDFAQSLHLSWDTGGPTLMSITAHDRFRLHDIVDHDESAVPSIDNRQGGTFGSSQFTQEVRLVSPGHDAFRYTLGLFYSKVDFTRDFTRGQAFSLARWQSTNSSKQTAGFGQLEYDVLPHTTVIAGGRYAHEKVDYTFRDILNGNAYFNGGDGDTYGTYKLAVQQHVSDDVMLFVSYATGHKGEAYDLSTGFNANRAAAGPIKPETSTDWEAGARTQFFERRLTLNATVFDTHFKDFQAQGIETLPDGSVNFRLANVGKLRSRGVELEASARATDELTLGSSVTYSNARITDFPLAQCYAGQTAAQGCLAAAGPIPAHQNLAGARAPQAPEWKLTANFDYAHQLDAIPFKLVAQGAYTYQSKINYSLSQDPQTIQGGYGVANLAIGLRQPERHYEIMAFVNNVFNKHYYDNITNSQGTYNGQLATQSYLPRDFARYAGIRAAYSF